MDTSKFAGKQFYALVTRMGGMYRDIHALAVYGIRENGVPYKINEAIRCVANKSQYAFMHELTKSCGYVSGRPTRAYLAALTEEKLSALTGA